MKFEKEKITSQCLRMGMGLFNLTYNIVILLGFTLIDNYDIECCSIFCTLVRDEVSF